MQNQTFTRFLLFLNEFVTLGTSEMHCCKRTVRVQRVCSFVRMLLVFILFTLIQNAIRQLLNLENSLSNLKNNATQSSKAIFWVQIFFESISLTHICIASLIRIFLSNYRRIYGIMRFLGQFYQFNPIFKVNSLF